MKKFYSLLKTTMICTLMMCMMVTKGNAQTTYTVGGSGSPNYATLTAALSALNTGGLSGNTILELQVGYTSGSETFPITMPTYANPYNYTLTIRPATGASGLVITSANTTATINFNGAAYVYIDGSVHGNATYTTGTNLLIANTSGSAPAVYMQNGAVHNTVEYAELQSNNTGQIGYNGGVVLLGNTSGTVGNNSNTIDHCNIHNISGGNPVTGVSSVGNTTHNNTGNTISNCNIYDYFAAATATAGIFIYNGNSTWSITGNHLYQTASRTYTSGNNHTGITVLSGDGYTINNNVIGFNSSDATAGTYTNMLGITTAGTASLSSFPSSFTLGTANLNSTAYTAISCSFTSGGTVSDIQNNTIGGIALLTSISGNGINGIVVNSGAVNIGTVTGNIIGAATGNSSIFLASSSTTAGGQVVGINVATSGTDVASVQNNTIGAIDASSTSATTAASFAGINVNSASGNLNISANNIGNSNTAFNIRVGYLLSGSNLGYNGTMTTATGGSSMGINCASVTGNSITISGNFFQNWQISGSATSVQGIYSSGAMTGTKPSFTANSNHFGTAVSGTGVWVTYTTACSGAVYGIWVGNTGATTNSIQYNDFRGLIYSVANAQNIYFIIYTGGTAANNVSTISYNTFTNLTVNTTNNIYFIDCNYAIAATGIRTVNNNSIVTAFNNNATSASGLNIFYSNKNSTAGAISNFQNNNFSNITMSTSGNSYGICDIDANSIKNYTSNIFNNWTNNTIGAVYGTNINGSAGASTVNGNTVTNISSQGSVSGIYTSGTVGTSLTIYNNTINHLNSTGTGSTVNGIYSANTSATVNIYNNQINTLSSTSLTYQVAGIYTSSSGGTFNVYKNRIYAISSTSTTSPLVSGICVGSGIAVNLYNNMITDISAATANATNPVRGININGGTTVNAYYNTVLLSGTSSGATFGSSAIYVNTGTALTLNNNIFINNTTPVGAGYAVAYYRSSATISTYNSTSNNNIFYAGTPGTNNLIYYDGTNNKQDIVAYKNFVSPIDNVSASENVSFLSNNPVNTGVKPYLYVNPAIAGSTWQGATTIASVSDDIDGKARPLPPNTKPCIGANEYTLPPAITGFSPKFGGTGTTVTITGSHFTGATGVTFGGTAGTNVTIVNDNTITANVDTGSSGNVCVSTGSGTGCSVDTFIYFPPLPVITSFTPTSGTTGTIVTIKGSYFTGVIDVMFGGTWASSVNFIDDNTITAVVGNGSIGSIAVIVHFKDGNSTGISSGIFTYLVAGNTAPVFFNTSPQALALCENAGATSINSILAITDPDAGQTETYSVTGAPLHGSITVGTTVGSGTGLLPMYGSITTSARTTRITGVWPTGWSYTPANGYSGTDAFTIQVNDGNGGTASTTVNVTVNTPSSSVTNTSICASALPYIWNGLTFTGAGTQTAHITNMGGCDSAATLNLTVILPPSAFSYTTPNTFTVGTAITALSPDIETITTLGSGFSDPQGVAMDAAGNIYVADAGNNAVKKIANDGTITTLGSGFNYPMGVAVDAAGNVYVGDENNNAVKKIAPDGVTVTTLGSGFYYPKGVAVDAAGNVYVADASNNTVKKIATDGVTVTTLGSGFSSPMGVAVDATGNVYVADASNNTVKKIATDGVTVTTLGSGFNGSTGIALDAAGNVYVADNGNNAVKKIAPDGVTVTTLGSGFNNPMGVAVDAAGNVYVADTYNNAVKKIPVTGGAASSYSISPALPAGLNFNTGTGVISGTPATGSHNTIYTVTASNCGGNTITTLAIKVSYAATVTATACGSYTWHGNTYRASGIYTFDSLNVAGYDSITTLNLTVILPPSAFSYTTPDSFVVGTAITPLSPVLDTAIKVLGSGFNGPAGLAVDAAGNVYVADNGNNAVKKIAPDGITVTTLGSGFNQPIGVAVDAAGNVYVADAGNNAVKKIAPDGITITTLGSGFNQPEGVAIDAAGNVYVADNGNIAVKKIAPDGITITTLGSGFNNPFGVAVDALGNVYVGDNGNNAVKKIAPDGITVTNLGSGFFEPYGVAVDAAGNVYVADFGISAVKKIAPDGTITTLGSGFIMPVGIAVDASGNVYVADYVSALVKKIPVNGSAASSYSISPALPAGLSFNTVTGVISGTPAKGSNNTIYTVTASNCSGNTTSTLGIKVTCTNTTATVTVSACGSYTWHGTTYNASTNTPTFDTLNVAGCDSLVTLHLTIKTPTSSVTNLTINTSALPYIWNGLTFTGAGTQTYYTLNAVGCDSAATLNLTVNAVPVFVNTSPQALAICENAGATSINTLLTINDPDAGQTETFSVTGAPLHGSITVGTTVSGTGLMLMYGSNARGSRVGTSGSPTGWSYTPASGYSGTDVFTIQVSDGNGGIASTTVNVTVNAGVTPSVSIAANPSGSIVAGTSVTFTATPANGGSAPAYQWKKNGGNVGTNSNTYTDAGLANNDVITCVMTANNSCQTTATANSNNITETVTASVSNYVWTGATSTDWSVATNWSNNVLPTTGVSVTIPSAPTNQPVLSTDVNIGGIALNGSLAINGHSFTITGAVTGTGKLKGSATSSLVVNSNSINTLYFGTTATDSMLANLTVSGTGTLTLGTGLGITGVLSVTNGTFSTGNHLTLKSTSITNTAVVGVVSGTITGKVTVERYIPQGNRAFRDLGAEVANSGAILNNWQEGGTYPSGYGIYITGVKGTAPGGVDATTGLDKTQTGNPSLYIYGSGSWPSVTNTRTNSLDPFMGYRASIRGDRTYNIYAPDPGTMVNATTLRATGNLVTGNVVYNTTNVTSSVYTSTAAKLISGLDNYSFVANPYACPIDWEAVYANGGTTNLTASYWYFDPTFMSNGYATYVTYNAVSHVNSNHPTSKLDRYIQPGMAFFVQNSNSSNPTLSITESNKAPNSTKTAVYGVNAAPNYLQVSLWKNINGVKTNIDGAVAVFNNNFTKVIGDKDSKKLTNGGENLFITQSNTDLSIAGLPVPTVNDVIALQLTQLTANTEYQLQVDATDFSANGIETYIHDEVNNTDVSAAKGLTFTPISNAVSNRFSLVFKPATVIASTAKGMVSVYPNPVINKVFTLQTTNLVKGRYQLRLMNSMGQEVIKSIINHPDGSATNTISTSQLPSGVYILSMVGESGSYKTEVIVK